MPSVGPNSPQSYGSDVTGDVEWDTSSDPSGWNLSSNDVYATVTFSAISTTSTGMVLYDFDWDAVPDSAAIVGVVVEVEWASPSADVTEWLVQLTDTDFTPIGVSRASGATLPASDSYVTFGGPTDLWECDPMTGADIKAGFGLGVKVRTTSIAEPAFCRLDHARMTVYYTETDPAETGFISPTIAQPVLLRPRMVAY